MQVHDHSKVTLHFSLNLEDGQTVDSTYEADPATLSIGDGSLPEGFEKHLLGMAAGETKAVVVPPEEAFGQPNPANIQRFKKEQFAQTGELEIGMMMSFKDAGDNELPGMISEINGDVVMVDFNHPLAGKPLNFKVDVIAVEDANGGH
ncbi:FKBP-type peptidyl-prolyl cis-trans isomerase [Reinekea marina]|uniref:Peptidyl-prolyl cis-trans isomerase n=1 Tax=Reinekea marina TaxID=1310421 RepID=A0ABV7WSY7_9GAMM